MGKQKIKKNLLSNRIIYTNIRRIAKDQKMTMKALSNRLGKADSYLSATFTKKEKLASLELLLQVAFILQCDLDDLIQLPTEGGVDQKDTEK